MMNAVTVGRMIPEDVIYVGDRLREEDVRELEHASKRSAQRALVDSVKASEYAGVGYFNGTPGIVFGVASGGVIWMVCTDEVRKHKEEVFWFSKRILKAFLTRYPILWNRADCRNELHIHWLRKAGFTLDEIEEVNGLPFQRFHMSAEGQDHV